MRNLLVLCYHAVSDSWPASLSLAAERLEEQVAGLLERGYAAKTFSDALQEGDDQRTLAVTFDDGYRSVIEHALPVLSRLGIPGTVFVPTDFVGTARPMSWPGIERWVGGPHERELVPMGWDELATLVDAGWEIGSHSHSHTRLTRVSDAELVEELESSRTALQDGLGVPCRSIAYPYGDVDGRVASAAREVGYEVGGGLAAYELGANPLHWPRVGIYREDSRTRFAFKVSRLARSARLTRLRHALSRS